MLPNCIQNIEREEQKEVVEIVNEMITGVQEFSMSSVILITELYNKYRGNWRRVLHMFRNVQSLQQPLFLCPYNSSKFEPPKWYNNEFETPLPGYADFRKIKMRTTF